MSEQKKEFPRMVYHESMPPRTAKDETELKMLFSSGWLEKRPAPPPPPPTDEEKLQRVTLLESRVSALESAVVALTPKSKQKD